MGGWGEGEGTKSLLILTPELTKGIFLMSLKQRFLIRDVRPISHKREKQQPQTLKQLTGSWLESSQTSQSFSKLISPFLFFFSPEQLKQDE